MEAMGGQQLVGAGIRGAPSMVQDGSLAVKNIGGPFEEAVRRGKVWSVAMQAGVASQAGLSLTTPVLSLYNAAGSGVNGFLWFASVIHAVAPAAACVTWIGANAGATTGTPTTAHRNLLLNGAQPTLQPLLAATLAAVPVAISQLGAGLTGAITTITNARPLERWYNGCICVPPGYTISIQTSTASGASGLFAEFIWEEKQIFSAFP